MKRGLSGSVLCVCLLTAASAAHARSIRVDAGTWDPLALTLDAPDFTPIGLDFTLGEFTFNSIRAAADGRLELGAAGSGAFITPFLLPNDWTLSLLSAETSATSPFGTLTSGLRINWEFDRPSAENLFVQLNLYTEGADLLAEFNYQTDELEVGLPLNAQFGLLNDGLGLGFDLSQALAAQPDQAACTSSLGRYNPIDDTTAECTGYFLDGNYVSATLPGFFVGESFFSADPPADGRYLLRYTGQGGNPTPVPEPATWTLFLAGLGLLAARQLRERARAVR